MAFQTRSRDPLLDSNMQAAIEKRGKELIGIALIMLGLMAAAMIGSYTPDDPNWWVSTDAPVQNWLGRPGASITALLFMIVGKGAWAISLILLMWGARFVLHWGEDRAMPRTIFAPIAIALSSVYAANLVPDAIWEVSHNFGLGGLFGDTVMGALLTLSPINYVITVKLMTLLTALSMLTLGAFVLGFTRPELARGGRFMLVGVVMAYAGLANLLGRGATGGLQAAMTYRAQRAQRAADADDELQVIDTTDRYGAVPAAEAASEPAEDVLEEPTPERGGLLSRMPSMIRRSETITMPEPELVERHSTVELDAAPGDDRIAAKIADAVRERRAADLLPEHDPNLPLTKGRGRRPEPLVFNPQSPLDGLPPEPPMTAMPVPPMTAMPVSLPVTAPVIAPDSPELEPENAMVAPSPMAPPVAVMPLAPMELPVAAPRKSVVELPVLKPVLPSARAIAEAQPGLGFEDSDDGFELPPLNLLASTDSIERHHLSDDALEENARMLEHVLDDYGVKGEIVAVRPGPVVTMYELEPAPGLKASRVIGLSDDIARSMSALSARVSTVPGRSVIGIELPNENREKVMLREILASRDFGDSTMSLPLALGKDIGGDSMVANLAKMPHLLIAGTTGSGKSVAINTMILSLLYKLTPAECRMIMIDPKMLELSVYDGIPHLLSPVVTDPKKAVVALKWTVGEMEDRYRKMSKMGVRNIEGYNGRVREALDKGEMFSRTVQTGFDDDTGEPVFESEEFAPKVLPYIVVIVDEMADLMMVAGKEIEACIQRLAQMARASGIHLIMATQRPSVDVITGTIKANFPTRISFQVTSKIDSRTILGEMGAEQLLGMGDMLYMAGGAKITRCHGPFVSDEEVEEIVNHLKAFGPPEYMSNVLDAPDDDKASNIDAVLGLTGGNTTTEDALYDTAVQIVTRDRKCSTSYIQRKLAIGYNKAARLVEQMEDEGLVSPANHVGKREILIPEPQ
ncbi:DNA translocase FtsK [Parasedimentitalea psychrophila]|uniref:DNA translocase FtsK n=1 Tax=Parasedimentitalea psychrophila TaxID=2997337 RepID=A0A9Y2L1J0_9RHOB|nr:DNA translocase FtsK [Parasedimentitalea psychrophila]WIY26996.1 DNA translocase FtsK 4TM domain-containing protein [Parasedimentitalea psychrophila]